MKDLAGKVFKFIGASIGLLVAAYSLGWSGAIALHNIFKTERAEAQHQVERLLESSERRLTEIHNADMQGINGKMDILIEQNKVIISRLPSR